jgi:hypothetical protein
MEDAERLFIEDFDTWDMTGYYLYSKYWRAGVSAHIGTGGVRLHDPRISGYAPDMPDSSLSATKRVNFAASAPLMTRWS